MLTGQQLPSVLDPSQTYNMWSTLLVNTHAEIHTFYNDAIKKIDETATTKKTIECVIGWSRDFAFWNRRY
jgi:hypothetical protein